MSFKRLVSLIAAVSVALLVGGNAQAKNFALGAGGGQAHIGNGLMLPIQAAATAATTGTNFPTLLVPVVPGATVNGTTVKPLLNAVGKSGYQRTLNVPAGVLNKPAAQTTIGVHFSNPTVFAVGTNLGFVWPKNSAVFAQTTLGTELGPATVAGLGGTLTYSNALGQRFGGAAQFHLTGGAAAGILPAPVTVYIKINATTPACTHPAFGGADAGCVAGLILAVAGGSATLGAGGATATTVNTPGGVVAPNNIAIVKLGLTPLGTVLIAVPAANNPGIPTNKATSQPGPWTTGKVVISQPAALGALEKFTLSGKDSRTVGGAGAIQLVSGALSARTASGPNGNRAWVTLFLTDPSGVPSMSPAGLAAMAGLILLAGGYASRRGFFASRRGLSS